MSDEIEMPNEVLERHEHATEHQGHPAAAAPHKDRHAGRMTLIVILLAMAAAISGKVSSQAELVYLTRHVELSDTWAEYQAKSDRQFTAEGLAALAAVMPNAADPAVQKAIEAFKASAAHMASDEHGAGKKQLAEKAAHIKEMRDTAMERLEGFELVVSVLAIAIGLGSASLLARGTLPRMALGGVSAVSGLAASIYGLFVFFA